LLRNDAVIEAFFVGGSPIRLVAFQDENTADMGCMACGGMMQLQGRFMVGSGVYLVSMKEFAVQRLKLGDKVTLSFGCKGP
jgi:hypothetical protein